MATIKLWAKRAIYKLLVTPFNGMLCALIRLATQMNFTNSNIRFIVRALSIIHPNYKYSLSYVRVVEAKEYGTLVGRFNATLCSSKPQFYYEQNKIDINFNNSEYAVIIKNSAVHGSSNVVSIDEGKVIYELYNYDKHNKYKYTDAVILSHQGDFFVIQYRKRIKNIEKGILLSGNYSYNYYHYVYEILSKFHLLDKLQIPNDVPLLIDEVVGCTPQFTELLQYFNVKNREVILLKIRHRYNVKNLYYISTINFIPPNYNNINSIVYSDCQFSAQNIDYLRSTLLQKMGSIPTYKRIYLSRKNASNRRKYNENEVLTVFKKYDFEIVYPEEYTIAEQISLFNSADFIAGVTGAAFTNILFCKESCKILCIQSIKNELSIFSTVAKYLKLDMQYYSPLQLSSKIDDLHDDFTVNLIQIENILIKFLEK